MKVSTIVFDFRYRIIRFTIFKILPVLNRLKLRAYGISYGKDCQMYASCVLRVVRGAKMSIGDRFRVVSSPNVNPLCSRKACFNVANGATLEIGNHCGMSSPVIWVRKGIKIGNNVNLGGVLH